MAGAIVGGRVVSHGQGGEFWIGGTVIPNNDNARFV